MITDILNTYQEIIQNQSTSQEKLLQYHFRMSALLEVLLQGDLTQYPPDTLYSFLLTLSDLVKQAQTLNEKLLNTALKSTTTMDPSENVAGNTSWLKECF